MDFIIHADTDAGARRETNQDSLFVKLADTSQGRVAFAAVCDGMGGLSQGELASATVAVELSEWFEKRLPALLGRGLTDNIIRNQWETLVERLNSVIMRYGAANGISLGTTVTALLLTQKRWYLLNVGDSRAYEITDTLRQLTEDHTWVQREIKRGALPPEAEETHPKRNVLLQCVGASEETWPDVRFGDVVPGAVYMLCSDGFRHKPEPEELLRELGPGALGSREDMRGACRRLIDEDMRRGETDNISAALVKACP